MHINENNTLNDEIDEVKKPPNFEMLYEGNLRQDMIEQFKIDQLDFENIAFCDNRREAIDKAKFIVDDSASAVVMADTLRGCGELISAQQQFEEAVWDAECVWARGYKYTDLETGEQESVVDTEVMASLLMHSSGYNPVASYVLAQEQFRELARQIASDKKDTLGVALMDLVEEKYRPLLGTEPYPDEMPQELSREHFDIS